MPLYFRIKIDLSKINSTESIRDKIGTDLKASNSKAEPVSCRNKEKLSDIPQ